MSLHGAPRYLRSDNGPVFVSRAVLRWLTETNIDAAHIDPGKPWENGSNESFNGKFRDECLSMHWFKDRTDAKILIENFRREYNEVRPHSSLGQLTPAQLKQNLPTTTVEATSPKVTWQPRGWYQHRGSLEAAAPRCLLGTVSQASARRPAPGIRAHQPLVCVMMNGRRRSGTPCVVERLLSAANPLFEPTGMRTPT